MERGHAIGNHSHSHPNAFAFYGPRAVAREVVRAQDAIAAATGRRATLFRAPVGIRGPFLEACLAREGMSLVSWTRRGLDTVSRNAAAVASRLTQGVAPATFSCCTTAPRPRTPGAGPSSSKPFRACSTGSPARGLYGPALSRAALCGCRRMTW